LNGFFHYQEKVPAFSIIPFETFLSGESVGRIKAHLSWIEVKVKIQNALLE
jgi:hypothetical protein